MNLLEARFTDTATTPADALHVVINDIDGPNKTGPVAWAPRPGPTYPQAGDWAAVTETMDGTWCVVLWAPASLTP